MSPSPSHPLYRLLWLALGLATLTSVSSLLHSDDPCYRECVTGQPAMVCKYTFIEEIYTAMNWACGNCSQGVTADCSLPQCVQVDGVERTIYSINRMMPGPSIHVCAGDMLEVDLHVNLPGHGDTIHWHGLRQIQTPYMDGVSMITQCPVQAGQAFRYRFTVEDAGTHFYHTHNGVHKVNGAVGVLVARQPRDSDPSAALFDRDLAEHTVFLMDWMHVDAEARFPGLQDPAGQFASSVLINGKGNYQNADGTWTRTPLAEFPVQKGLRYRFRIINSGALACPIVLSFVGHNMTIIATDSKDVEPLTVDTLFTWSGERYDVVVAADQDGDAFWIHAYQAGACSSSAKDQVAVLRYSNDPTAMPASPRPSVLRLESKGLVMNAPSCGSLDGSLCVTDLRSAAAPEDDMLVAEPDNRSVLGVAFYSYSREELFGSDTYSPFLRVGDVYVAGTINNVSFQMPASPLLTQPGDSPRCTGCPDGEKHCTCTQVFPVALGDIHDIVIVDTTNVGSGGTAGMLSHPMHLHGYSFLVLGVGSLANITDGQERRRYVQDNTVLLRTASSRPPAKDTILLPAAGYAIVRILADNPGVWFFHCHFQYHMASGMEAAFQVGDAKDFVESPPNFPSCGDYMPVMT